MEEEFKNEEEREARIKEVAKELGVSLEFLRTMPPWIQEGRGIRIGEYTTYVRGQKNTCKEYVAAEPFAKYHGMCLTYLQLHRRHCGMPFVNKITCQTGAPREEAMKGPAWKDFRTNYDRVMGHKGVISRDRRGDIILPRVEKELISYTCEECGREFQSGRVRTGRLYCGDCAARLRREGRGPLQLAKRGKDG